MLADNRVAVLILNRETLSLRLEVIILCLMKRRTDIIDIIKAEFLLSVKNIGCAVASVNVAYLPMRNTVKAVAFRLNGVINAVCNVIVKLVTVL